MQKDHVYIPVIKSDPEKMTYEVLTQSHGYKCYKFYHTLLTQPMRHIYTCYLEPATTSSDHLESSPASSLAWRRRPDPGGSRRLWG